MKQESEKEQSVKIGNYKINRVSGCLSLLLIAFVINFILPLFLGGYMFVNILPLLLPLIFSQVIVSEIDLIDSKFMRKLLYYIAFAIVTPIVFFFSDLTVNSMIIYTLIYLIFSWYYLKVNIILFEENH